MKATRLQIGKAIRIPGNVAKAQHAAAQGHAKRAMAKPTSGSYIVRNGETDWTIAKRAGLTVAQLHRLNPNVDWRNLQIGAKLVVPSSAYAKPVASTSVAAAVPSAKSVSSGRHVVRSGENDWTLARKYGVTVSGLHQMNPGVNWRSLQIGQQLVVPGGKANSSNGNVAMIRTKRAIVTTDGVSVRRGAKTTASKLAVVSRGTEAAVLDRLGEWYKLRFPKGSIGWVRGDFLAPQKSTGYVAMRRQSGAPVRTATVAYHSPKSTNKKSAEPRLTYVNAIEDLSLLESAASMMGTRYRYGSSSRSATDCSGFTSQVFRTQGIKIPRTSRDQAKVGSAVSKDALKPGDLVFFNTRGSRISHVGIYKGNGQFYHASSGQGKVTVSSLNDGYYSRRYAGARRVSNNLKPSGKSAAKSDKKHTVDSDFEPRKEAESEDFDPKPDTPATKPTPGADEISR